jgi:hypothetical protein
LKTNPASALTRWLGDKQMTPAVCRGTRPVEATLVDYFRCPDAFACVEASTQFPLKDGYFTFEGMTYWGRSVAGDAAHSALGPLPDISASVSCDQRAVRLPFDLSAVVANLREERYALDAQHPLRSWTAARAARSIYYFLRPTLPVAVRKHLQRTWLNGWDRIAFPKWPVDVSVEHLMERTMTLVMKARGLERVPFVWFWPDGMPSATMMTHDVEGSAGASFCDQLMDLDDSYGIKSSFQFVPQGRFAAPMTVLEAARARGFEVNVHDLNHDGYLFHEKKQFEQRAEQINRYARFGQCRGFRSGSMYRKQAWFGAFELSYDMSVPNVAHLEAQRGGCCTVLPYFIGNILELPLTTTQDYSVFNILGDYSIALWKEQIARVRERNGLLSFVTHPDYLIEERARLVYRELLAHLSELRTQKQTWIALPADINRWWRCRRAMSLVPVGDFWRIEGPESHRARVAYARLRDGRLSYEFERASESVA